MASIVFADGGMPFDGLSPEERPLGGAEAACVGLLEALAARGHAVLAFTRTGRRVIHAGVSWAPLGEGIPEGADLYIGNRGHRLIGLVPEARRRVFWIHNPAGYLLKPRFLWPLLRHRPAIVFSGAYHAATYPAWAPCGRRVVIPYGLPEAFRHSTPRADVPPPRAIFTSNPLRGLDWLVERWATAIRPRVPGAELHVFAGSAVYGGKDADRMAPVIARARAHAGDGVVMREPVPRTALIAELNTARAMLYRGDPGETFCLALGEAQALGLPCVVQPVGSVGERVRDGETGFVAGDDAIFADRAVALLTDDALWRRQNAAACATQGAFGWPEAAAAWEGLLPAR